MAIPIQQTNRIQEIHDYFSRLIAQARYPQEIQQLQNHRDELMARELGQYGMIQRSQMPWNQFVGQWPAYAAQAEPAKSVKPLPEDHIVTAIIGYRAWNVPLFVDELRSVARPSKWLPYQKFSAQCEGTQCEGVSCHCGVYAFNQMKLVQKEYTTLDRCKRYVYGECWLWGRVLECKDGYRAQFAYPKSFIDNGAISKRMAEIFGVALCKG